MSSLGCSASGKGCSSKKNSRGDANSMRGLDSVLSWRRPWGKPTFIEVPKSLLKRGHAASRPEGTGQGVTGLNYTKGDSS